MQGENTVTEAKTGSEESVEQALEEARRRAAPPASDLLAALASRLGLQASVSAAFGDPVEREGVTVIPVARTGFGFGGGAGRGLKKPGGSDRAGTAEDSDGGGGGGGAGTQPVGFITVAGGKAAFTPIREPARALIVPLAAIAGLTAVQLVRVILRHNRKR